MKEMKWGSRRLMYKEEYLVESSRKIYITETTLKVTAHRQP